MRRGISPARAGPWAATSFFCSWVRELTVCSTLRGETTPAIGLRRLGIEAGVSEDRWARETSLLALAAEVAGEDLGASPSPGKVEGKGYEPLACVNLALAHLMPS